MTYLGTPSWFTLLWGVHLDLRSGQWCPPCLWFCPFNPHFAQWGCMCPYGVQQGPCPVSLGQSKVTFFVTVLLLVLAIIHATLHEVSVPTLCTFECFSLSSLCIFLLYIYNYYVAEIYLYCKEVTFDYIHTYICLK